MSVLALHTSLRSSQPRQRTTGPWTQPKREWGVYGSHRGSLNPSHSCLPSPQGYPIPPCGVNRFPTKSRPKSYLTRTPRAPSLTVTSSSPVLSHMTTSSQTRFPLLTSLHAAFAITLLPSPGVPKVVQPRRAPQRTYSKYPRFTDDIFATSLNITISQEQLMQWQMIVVDYGI